ncbi:hypothetical protein MTR67_040468 [Solanum verrucosum]|uniref:Uncharacterized protein n=1 Tax=Solanum verrucosum TaxID=315347 RepID=A0AAF0UKG0_SOLVR|nr:hypothetical protein MTR67_040468 [Solanum verrucosum]
MMIFFFVSLRMRKLIVVY